MDVYGCVKMFKNLSFFLRLFQVYGLLPGVLSHCWLPTGGAVCTIDVFSPPL